MDDPKLFLRAFRVGLDELRRRLRRQRNAEKRLADRVVQLAREAISLLDDRQLATALVQARVLDRDRGVGGQQLDQLLVRVREYGAAVALLVG